MLLDYSIFPAIAPLRESIPYSYDAKLERQGKGLDYDKKQAFYPLYCLPNSPTGLPAPITRAPLAPGL